jgi:hypothetical protein
MTRALKYPVKIDTRVTTDTETDLRELAEDDDRKFADMIRVAIVRGIREIKLEKTLKK